MDEATKKATAKALEWLATKQNADGSFSDGAYAHNTAITAYAMLAFMSQGHLPNQGKYGPEVAKAARFLMASPAPTDGYLVGARGGNMYCHAMATLALAELWGQTGDDEIKPVVQEGGRPDRPLQNPQGGWRYEPQPTGADISVTIMQVMALRAAKNAGMHVPDDTLKKAIAYIKSCYNARRRAASPTSPAAARPASPARPPACASCSYRRVQPPRKFPRGRSSTSRTTSTRRCTSTTATITPPTPCTRSAARNGRTGTAGWSTTS